MYCWYLYIFLQTLFLLYSVAWVSAVSNICDICLFLKFSGLPHAFSFVYKLLINHLAIFPSKIHKFIIRLDNFFHRQICIHFSACYEKEQKLDGPPGCPPFTFQAKLVFNPAIMPQGIVIVQRPPLSIMIRNNFRLLELDYIPINHPSLFLLTLRHSQDLKG